MRSDIKLYFRGRCSGEVLPLGQGNSETSFLQGYEFGTLAGRSAGRGDSESKRISQAVSNDTPSPQIVNMATRSTDATNSGLRGLTQFRQVSNTITTRCDNDTQGVFPINATPEGLARTIKAQYYKNGVANFIRTDGFGATGVICVGDMKNDV